MLALVHSLNILLFFKFKLIYLRSIAKQVIPTYINHSRPLILDGIHLFFLNEVWEEREPRPVLICWALSKEASGTIFMTSLVWRGRGSNPRPPAYGANALTTETPLHLLRYWCLTMTKCRFNTCKCNVLQFSFTCINKCVTKTLSLS